MTPGQTKLLIVAGALVTGGLFWFAPQEGDVPVSEPSKAIKAPKVRDTNPTPMTTAAQSLDKKLNTVDERGRLTKKGTGALFAKLSLIHI